jgi:hypothetical protein
VVCDVQTGSVLPPCGDIAAPSKISHVVPSLAVLRCLVRVREYVMANVQCIVWISCLGPLQNLEMPVLQQKFLDLAHSSTDSVNVTETAQRDTSCVLLWTTALLLRLQQSVLLQQNDDCVNALHQYTSNARQSPVRSRDLCSACALSISEFLAHWRNRPRNGADAVPVLAGAGPGAALRASLTVPVSSGAGAGQMGPKEAPGPRSHSQQYCCWLLTCWEQQEGCQQPRTVNVRATNCFSAPQH